MEQRPPIVGNCLEDIGMRSLASITIEYRHLTQNPRAGILSAIARHRHLSYSFARGASGDVLESHTRQC